MVIQWEIAGKNGAWDTMDDYGWALIKRGKSENPPYLMDGFGKVKIIGNAHIQCLIAREYHQQT